MAKTRNLVRAVNSASTIGEADKLIREQYSTFRDMLIFMSGEYDESIRTEKSDELNRQQYRQILCKIVTDHNWPRIKLFIEVATDFKEVDAFLNNFGLETVQEKISLLKRFPDVRVIGEQSLSDEDVYFTMVHGIISYEFK